MVGGLECSHRRAEQVNEPYAPPSRAPCYEPGMGDLRRDTAVEALDEGSDKRSDSGSNAVADTSPDARRFRGEICPDWDLWGPVGGYLAAIAVRAAGASTALDRPASVACHYLSPARFGPVELSVTTGRRSRRAQSLRVLMTQRAAPVLEALVWAVAADLPGPDAHWVLAPDAPPPDALPVFDPAQDLGGDPTAATPFWKNVEIRQVFLPGESRDPGGEPMLRSWERYLPQGAYGDPWADAARLLISADVSIYPAIAKGFAAPNFIAPNLDLYVAFHTAPPTDEHLLIETRGTAAGGGLVSGRTRIWSPAGDLVASGTSQLLCRMF